MADSYDDSENPSEIQLASSCFPLEFTKTNLFEYEFCTDIVVNSGAKEELFKIYRRKYGQLLRGCYYQDGLIYSKNLIPSYGNQSIFFRKMNQKITLRIVFNGRHNSFESTKMDLLKFVYYRMSTKRKRYGNMIFLEPITYIEGVKMCNSIQFRANVADPKFIFISIKQISLDDENNITWYRFLPREVKKWILKEKYTRHTTIQKYFQEISNYLSDFGIIIYQPRIIIGKCLKVPELLPEDPTEALYKPPVKQINCAIVSDQSNNSVKIYEFQNYLKEYFQKIGIKIAKERFYMANPIMNGSEDEIRDIFEDLNDHGVTYALILTKKENPLSERNVEDSLFDMIKLHGLVYQIFNQILRFEDLVSDLRPDMIASLAAKMCFKQGGQINAIDPRFWNQYPFDVNTTMFIGIHIFSTKIRNVNIFYHSMVGTTGPDYCLPNLMFEAKLSRRQDPKLVESMLEHLLEKAQNRAKPKNLIIFCNNYLEKIHLRTDIKMTFIRVDLKSPFQFSRVGSELEVPHGTCADIDLVTAEPSKKFVIFIRSNLEYLIEETRQTEFEVLWDDTEMSANQIKNLCFTLCHLYSVRFQANLSPTILHTAFKYGLRVKRKLLQFDQANEDDSLDTLIEKFHQNILFY